MTTLGHNNPLLLYVLGREVGTLKRVHTLETHRIETVHTHSLNNYQLSPWQQEFGRKSKQFCKPSVTGIGMDVCILLGEKFKDTLINLRFLWVSTILETILAYTLASTHRDDGARSILPTVMLIYVIIIKFNSNHAWLAMTHEECSAWVLQAHCPFKMYQVCMVDLVQLPWQSLFSTFSLMYIWL